jgi:ribose-phosphate pyrophosphokinase
LGFFKIHSEEISGRSTIVNFLKSQKIGCVVSPDAGFQKDATKYQHELLKAYGGSKDVCLAVMNKERNSDGQETILGGTGIENITGKHVVIIDDETASGGTLSQVAQVLQRYQPKSVFAVVTHLAGPAQKSLNSENIQHLVVTDTVPASVSHQKLKVLSIAPEIAAGIAAGESNR